MHKALQLFLTLILLTTSLHAEPTFTLEDMVVLISSLISIVLLIISFIIRVFKKNNTLIYISLSFHFLLNTILFLSDIPDRFKINSRHYFQKLNTKEYTHLQTMVKELIDTSVKSPELVQTLNIHTLKSEKLETFREILMRKPSITYGYSVEISKNQAYVYVSSKDFPLLHIIFIFTKTDKWVISDILYQDKEHLNIFGSWL